MLPRGFAPQLALPCFGTTPARSRAFRTVAARLTRCAAAALATLLAPATPLFADVGHLLVFQLYLGAGTQGTGPGEFVFPFGLGIYSTGRFIVSDTESYDPVTGEVVDESNRIQIFEPDGTWAAEFGGTGDLPGEFWYPTGVAVDASDQIVVADSGNHRIQVFGPAGGTGTPVFLAEFGTYGNYDPLDETSEAGPAPNDRLYFPSSVAVQPGTELFDGTGLGRLAIVDNSNHRVVVLDSELVPLFSFGGYGTDDNLPGTFEYPWGVTINSLGHFYVSDPLNHRVQVFDGAGQVFRTFGNDETTPVPAPGDLSSPSALAFDGAARLLVADTDRSRVLQISLAELPGGVSATPRCADVIESALQGRCHILTSEGTLHEARVLGGLGSGESDFLYAQGVGADPSGRVVVVDTDQHAVKVFTPARIEVVAASVDAGAGGQVAVPLTLTVTVANPGVVSLDVTLGVSSSLAGTLNGDRFAVLPGGDEHTFELTFVPEQDGMLTFVVGADGVHDSGVRVPAAPLTTDPAVLVAPAAAPNLLVQIGADPAFVGIGDSIQVTVALINSGSVVFGTIVPVVTVSPNIATPVAVPSPDLSPLPPGTRELTYEFTAAQEGTATFAVSVTATYEDSAQPPLTVPYPDPSGPPLTATSSPVRISADTDPPVTTSETSSAPETSGWYLAPFTVTLTADDADGTGVDRISYQVAGLQSFSGVTTQNPVSLELSEVFQGLTTLRFFATDHAGNSEAPQTREFRLDTVPPTIGRVDISPPPNAAGWHNSDVTVSFVAGDSTSGVESVTPPVIVSTEGAGQIVTGVARDRAGHQTSVQVVVNIDKSPPIVTCGTLAGGVVWPPNHKMVPWMTTVHVSDALSGPNGFSLTAATSSEPDNGRGDGNTTGDIEGFVVGTPDTNGWVRADRSGTGGGRVYSLTYEARDLAGNEAACTIATEVPHDQGGKKK